MSEPEYDQCAFPFKDRANIDSSWIEFRSIFPTPTSPLTGAGYKITPFGAISDESTGKRYLHGRVAGYRIDFCPPACTVGHNRVLVNGVYQAAIVGVWLLKYWLACNGCGEDALKRVNLENSRIVDVTLTFLFPLPTEHAARVALREFRAHSEGLLNKKGRQDQPVKNRAYSYPPVQASEADSYTSYIREREYKIKAYVKEVNQPNAFFLRIKEDDAEDEVQRIGLKMLRVENSVHGKWLEENALATPMQWRENPQAYERVFGVVRDTLRLDDGLRTQRLKRTTVPALNLRSSDKRILLWHLSGKDAWDHPDVTDKAVGDARNKFFSAVKRRIQNEINIDVTTPWKAQSRAFSSLLSNLLRYPGEYAPPSHLAPYVFSRSSVPRIVTDLTESVGRVLEGASSSTSLGAGNAVSGAGGQERKERRYARGVGSVPVRF